MRIQVFLSLILPLAFAGCASSPPAASSNPHQGYSLRYPGAKKDSNFSRDYPEAPTFSGNPEDKGEFQSKAGRYLQFIKTDIEHIASVAKETDRQSADLLLAAERAKQRGPGNFLPPYSKGPEHPSCSSALSSPNSYPTFPDFYGKFPEPPGRFSGGKTYEDLKAEFSARVWGYVADARNFVRNCRNDIATLEKYRNDFLKYIDGLNAGGAYILPLTF